MKSWRNPLVVITGTVAVSVLLLTGLSSAQEGTAAESSPAEDPLEVERKALEETIGTRKAGNDQEGSTQKQIDALSDETDSLTEQYRAALKQVDSIEVYNKQMRTLIRSQESELTSLEDQLDQVELVGRSVTPLMLRMIDTLEKFVQIDVPFLPDERTDRVAELRETMSRADVTTPDKFRQIMEAYQIENEYGRTIEAYRGTLDIDGRETTVDFLRFGRIALVYQSLDQTLSGYWDRDAGSWEPLDADYRSAIRDGLRIARKQSAPDLIRLPLPAASTPEEAS